MTTKISALVPVYNNRQTIERTVTALLDQLDRVVVIDDGSDDGTAEILDGLAVCLGERIDVTHLPRNQGKGGAVQAGFMRAHQLGITRVLQVDADGQHDIRDIPRFVAVSDRQPGALVLGIPIFDETIPAIRKYGRLLTKGLIALETGSCAIPDTMCGYRVYPIAAMLRLGRMSSRMNFDPEVVVRAIWANVPIVQVPTKVIYLGPEEGGVSHFRMVRDNLLNIMTHTSLLIQAPWRLWQARARTASS